MNGNEYLDQFEQFMDRREHAAETYVSGNAVLLDRMVARTIDATFFAPSGGHVHGTQAVAARYDHDAGAFDEGSKSSFEIFQMGADAGVGYWAGIQHAAVHMKGKDEAVTMDLRVTEIFRQEEGEWKLVHRHADGLADEDTKP